LAIFELPAILNPANLSRLDGVVLSVLFAFALLAVLGIRYPIKMLPLLFFELLWKSIWVVAFGLPLLLSDGLDPNTTETLTACLMGVVLVPLVMPWGYVFKHYLKAPGDRWRKQVTTAPACESTDPDDGVLTGVDQPAAVVPSNGHGRSKG
jgi:hypothetical protein